MRVVGRRGVGCGVWAVGCGGLAVHPSPIAVVTRSLTPVHMRMECEAARGGRAASANAKFLVVIIAAEAVAPQEASVWTKRCHDNRRPQGACLCVQGW